MNPATFSILFILNYVSAWNWNGMKKNPSDTCSTPKAWLNETDLTWGVCWEAMVSKRTDLSNVTAIFQPGFWERDYSEIIDFCSNKGNGTFCYRPKSQISNSCLDMAVVRCPEGILSSCRSNFICNEIMKQNILCNSTVGSIFNTSYTESGQAYCEAIEDVIKLPPAENVTTTVDQQNKTITVGSQVFRFPFISTTTVDCTYTCLSTLPSGFPQPTQAITACFNDSLPYDELLPKTTCAGPYPPGPMTTITETICYSTNTPLECTIAPTGVISSSITPSVCMFSSTSECSYVSSMYMSSTILQSSTPINQPSSVMQNSVTELPYSPTFDTSIDLIHTFEPTPTPLY